MSEISRLVGKYRGTFRAALTATPEERRLLRTFSVKELMGISRFRYLSGLVGASMVCDWAGGRGMLESLAGPGSFTEPEYREHLEQKYHYNLQGLPRQKAAYSLLRILTESGYLREEGTGQQRRYKLVSKEGSLPRITGADRRSAVKDFGGLFEFYGKCLETMDEFLRSDGHSFDYTGDFAYLWQGFLGNPSQLFVKRYLYRSLRLPAGGEGLKAFVIAFGQGYDLFELLATYPRLRITTIDYLDDHIPRVRKSLEERFGSSDQVDFVSSAEWQAGGSRGFGVRLPFGNDTFDLAIGNSFDAAIPEGRREFVWDDITRIVKPGGKVGATVAMLPREDTVNSQDRWQRLYLFSHNFIESVTSDFVGFPYFDETQRLFEGLGYTSEPFGSDSLHLFNGFIWRMGRPVRPEATKVAPKPAVAHPSS